jgi:hypothetical protein
VICYFVLCVYVCVGFDYFFCSAVSYDYFMLVFRSMTTPKRVGVRDLTAEFMAIRDAAVKKKRGLFAGGFFSRTKLDGLASKGQRQLHRLGLPSHQSSSSSADESGNASLLGDDKNILRYLFFSRISEGHIPRK